MCWPLANQAQTEMTHTAKKKDFTELLQESN